MEFLGAFCILVTLSMFFLVYLKIKMEESMFISMSLVVILLTVFGLAGLMNIGQYVIYIFALIAISLIIYKLSKIKWKIDITEIVTPGFVIVALSYIIYIIVSKNVILHLWDEASCYGTAARYMDLTNKISNGGSVTILSYFFTEFAGFSEHALYVSRWLFIWICGVLPILNIKWDKWYLAAIYAVLFFGLVTIIDPEPLYMMDAPVGVAAGVGIAYLAVTRDKAKTMILSLSCFLAITTKDNVGMILLAFMFLYFIGYYGVELHSKNWKVTKKDIINSLIVIIFCILAIIIKSITMPMDLKFAVDIINKYLYLILFISILIIGIVLLWLFRLNKAFRKHITEKIADKPKIKKVIKILALSIIPFILFSAAYKIIWIVLYNFDIGLQQDFVYVLNQYFGRSYFGMSLWVVSIAFLITISVCVLTIIEKERKASFMAQALSTFLMILVYGIVIALLYTKVYHKYLETGLISIERYIGTLVIMICIWLMSLVFAGKDYWVDEKKQYLAAFGLSLMLVRCMPLPGETMFQPIMNLNMQRYRDSYRPMIKEHADIIVNNTPADARVLIISQGDDSTQMGEVDRHWFHYYIVPRPSPSVKSPSISSDDPRDDVITLKKLRDWARQFDFVYIVNVNDEFIANYGELFDTPVEEKALYKYTDDASKPLKIVRRN